MHKILLQHPVNFSCQMTLANVAFIRQGKNAILCIIFFIWKFLLIENWCGNSALNFQVLKFGVSSYKFFSYRIIRLRTTAFLVKSSVSQPKSLRDPFFSITKHNFWVAAEKQPISMVCWDLFTFLLKLKSSQNALNLYISVNLYFFVAK